MLDREVKVITPSSTGDDRNIFLSLA